MLAGRDVTATPPHVRTRMGLARTFQNIRVFRGMTVLENLELGAYLRRDRAEIGADMERVFTLFPRIKERRENAAS